MSHVNIIHQDLAVTNRYKSDNHVKTRGFARAIGPKEANDFAGFNLHGHAPDHFTLAERFMEIDCF
jgi:hypothetical protein